MPTSRQEEFLNLQCLEALYGGAAGGGKSSSLLMAALQHIDVPGYAALILRRTYADLSLPGALMDRARDWFSGTGARWRDTEKTWAFPGGGSITFGYLETERDKYRYQGAEFSFVGFDELTQFTETQYRYLLSRLRRLEGSEVPLRARCASNPGGIGHEWVKQRFLIEGESAGRPFIPARLEDNPYLDQAAYETSLAQLDPVTRAQLRHGDWDVLPEGRLFKREWFQVVEAHEVPVFASEVRFWDLAATEPKPGTDPDWTAGGRVGRTESNDYYLLDMRRERLSPRGVELLVEQTAREDGKRVRVWMEQEPGSAGKLVIHQFGRQVLDGYDFHGQRTTGKKLERARPFSATAEQGRFFLVRGAWNGLFLDEVGAFPSEGVHDDQVDAVSGALEQLASAFSIGPGAY